jgi:hypothetical protein
MFTTTPGVKPRGLFLENKMLLKITNNSGGTVANVTDGGFMYVSFSSVITTSVNAITHYKADNSGSYVAVPSGHKAEVGEITRHGEFSTVLRS